MADDEGDLRSAWPLDHRDADVAGLPGLHGHPRVHLAIIELYRAGIVDDEACVVRVAVRVELHDGEAAPDPVVDACLLEGGDLRPVHTAEDVGVGVHREAVERVFGEDHEVHRAQVAPGLGDDVDHALGLRGEIGFGRHIRVLELDETDDDAVLGLVETAESIHGRSPVLSWVCSATAQMCRSCAKRSVAVSKENAAFGYG